MRDSIGTNVEEMDLLRGERGKTKRKINGKGKGRRKKLWISYSQLSYIAQDFNYQHHCQ
jgi:hypothetical protein